MVVDTSVLIAGISAMRERYQAGRNASADFLFQWIEEGNFVWLVTHDILEEYRDVGIRRGIRRHVIGRLLNLLREEAETVLVRTTAEFSPDPKDEPLCRCAEDGKADFLVTLNPRDFPSEKLTAKVVAPSDFMMKQKKKSSKLK